VCGWENELEKSLKSPSIQNSKIST